MIVCVFIVFENVPLAEIFNCNTFFLTFQTIKSIIIYLRDGIRIPWLLTAPTISATSRSLNALQL